jgi:SSS family solute:Na+ symporter
VPLAIIVSFFLYGIFMPFSSPTYYQRIFAGKDSKTAAKGTWLSLLWVGIPMICLVIIGLAARSSFPGIDPELAFIKTVGQSGIFFLYGGSVLLWAALMSTADTVAFTTSQIVCHNIQEKKMTMHNARVALLAVLALSSIISLLLPSVIKVSILFLGVSMAIAVPLFLHWFMKFSSKAFITSMLVSAAGTLAYTVFYKFDPSAVGVALVLSLVTILIFWCCEKLLFTPRRA